MLYNSLVVKKESDSSISIRYTAASGTGVLNSSAIFEASAVGDKALTIQRKVGNGNSYDVRVEDLTVIVDGVESTFDNVTDAVAALSGFIGSFNAGGGSSGKNPALVFDTEEQMILWFAGEYVRPDGKTPADLKVPTGLYILEKDDPDYWFTGEGEPPYKALDKKLYAGQNVDITDGVISVDVIDNTFTSETKALSAKAVGEIATIKSQSKNSGIFGVNKVIATTDVFGYSVGDVVSVNGVQAIVNKLKPVGDYWKSYAGLPAGGYFQEIYKMKSGVLFALAETPSYYSENNGATWNISALPRGSYNKRIMTKKGRLILIYNAHVIYYTDDGINFTQIISLPNSFYYDSIIEGDSERIIATGYGNNSYYSDDDGETWSILSSLPLGRYSPVKKYKNGRLIFIGYLGNSYYTDDDGESFVRITQIPSGTYGNLYINKAERLILAAIGSSNSYYTDDGINWVQILSLPLATYNNFIENESGRVILVANNAVSYFSVDNYETWEIFSQIPIGYYRGKFVMDTGRIFLLVDGFPIYSDDDCETWTAISGVSSGSYFSGFLFDSGRLLITAYYVPSIYSELSITKEMELALVDPSKPYAANPAATNVAAIGGRGTGLKATVLSAELPTISNKFVSGKLKDVNQNDRLVQESYLESEFIFKLQLAHVDSVSASNRAGLIHIFGTKFGTVKGVLKINNIVVDSSFITSWTNDTIVIASGGDLSGLLIEGVNTFDITTFSNDIMPQYLFKYDSTIEDVPVISYADTKRDGLLLSGSGFGDVLGTITLNGDELTPDTWADYNVIFNEKPAELVEGANVAVITTEDGQVSNTFEFNYTSVQPAQVVVNDVVDSGNSIVVGGVADITGKANKIKIIAPTSLVDVVSNAQYLIDNYIPLYMLAFNINKELPLPEFVEGDTVDMVDTVTGEHYLLTYGDIYGTGGMQLVLMKQDSVWQNWEQLIVIDGHWENLDLFAFPNPMYLRNVVGFDYMPMQSFGVATEIRTVYRDLDTAETRKLDNRFRAIRNGEFEEILFDPAYIDKISDSAKTSIWLNHNARQEDNFRGNLINEGTFSSIEADTEVLQIDGGNVSVNFLDIIPDRWWINNGSDFDLSIRLRFANFGLTDDDANNRRLFLRWYDSSGGVIAETRDVNFDGDGNVHVGGFNLSELVDAITSDARLVNTRVAFVTKDITVGSVGSVDYSLYGDFYANENTINTLGTIRNINDKKETTVLSSYDDVWLETGKDDVKEYDRIAARRWVRDYVKRNAVNWAELEENTTLYIDTRGVHDPQKPNSIFNPYNSWAQLIADPNYGSNINIVVAPGSAMPGEDVTINNISNIIISAQSTPDASVVQFGNFIIAGNSGNVALIGVDIIGNLTEESSGEDISFENSWITGVITANPQANDGEPLRAWYHCTIEGDITLGGTGNALYYFENCWAGEGDTNKPTITLNNPNARLQMRGCEGFIINRMQGSVELDMNTIVYGYNSENTAGANNLISGRCIDPDTGELAPITCLGTADLSVGSFTYKRTGSNRAGVWKDGGIGVEQVRCNTVFQNIIARIVNSGGSEREIANLLIDFLWGIDDKLGELSAAISGANFTIQDSPDGSMIQFINNADQSLIYEFAKPEAIQGSDSISVSGGIASVILNEDSPIIHAIATALVNYVQSVPGKGLSESDYTILEKTWVASQATITSVTQSNGLSLAGGVLALNAADIVQWSGDIN